ncbi:MAG: SGNH/GDSL hydrolase family protein [Egibacteraceae bacterium]
MPRVARRHLNALRRPMPAGHAILVTVLALGLASLVNISSLREAAERQPFGWRRNVAVVLVAPLGGLSNLLGLDEPRALVNRELAVRQDLPWALGQAVNAPERARPERAQPELTRPDRRRSKRGRAFDASDPLRVWVVGDSVTEQLGPTLRDLTADTGVAATEHELHYSTGLSRADFFDWPARLDAIEEGSDPDVWVVMFGANDAQSIRAGGRHLEFGTPEWDAEYRRRVARVMTDLSSDGQQVIWVGQPVMRAAGFGERMAHLDDLYRSEAAHHPGVTFLDTWRLFADPDGAYSAYLPGPDGRPALMRLGDGIHLTRPGGERLAIRVLDVINQRWRLFRPAPGRPSGGS